MICVSHLTTLDSPPEAFIADAAAAGFDAVGLRIDPPKHTPDQWPIAGDLPRAKALRRQADGLGIAVFEVESFSVWPDMELDRMLPGLEAGAELGARFILSAGIDENEERLAANFARLCDAAAGFRLGVAIEFMPFRPLSSLPDAVRVLSKIARPNARLLIDALHLSRSGGTPADVAALDPSTIAYIHLCDAAASPDGADLADEARTRRLYPGDGGLPLAELLSVLPPELPLSIEAPDARYAGRSPRERLSIAAAVTRSFVSRCRPAAQDLAIEERAT